MPLDQFPDNAQPLKPEPLRDVDITSTGLYGANALHGLRRTNEDKRRAVMRLLEDADGQWDEKQKRQIYWHEWSDREIARQCSVGHKFVAMVRSSLTGAGASEHVPRTYTTKHGTVATMDTARIGRRTEPPGADPIIACRPCFDWEMRRWSRFECADADRSVLQENAMVSEPESVVVAWFSRKDYRDLRDLDKNSWGLPPNFEDWHRQAMEEVREQGARGSMVQRVPVLSWEFARWLRANGSEVSEQSVTRYVNEIAGAKRRA